VKYFSAKDAAAIILNNLLYFLIFVVKGKNKIPDNPRPSHVVFL
jgi:hypothetical protein